MVDEAQMSRVGQTQQSNHEMAWANQRKSFQLITHITSAKAKPVVFGWRHHQLKSQVFGSCFLPWVFFSFLVVSLETD
jgi:hypothetical protein